MNKLLALASALLLAGATATPVVAQQYDPGYGYAQSSHDDGDSGYLDDDYRGGNWRDDDEDDDHDDEDGDRDYGRYAVQRGARDHDEERDHRDDDRRDGYRGDRDWRRHGDSRWERHHERRRYAQQRYRASVRYAYPRGYRAGSWNIGSHLPSGYYSRNNYVPHRPYRLSPPPRGYQWVRVNNDVYLVSPSSGLIRDVLYRLFY